MAVINIVVQNAVAMLQKNLFDAKLNSPTVGASCSHTDFLDDTKLEACGHCNKKFCPPCLSNHKIFLRIEVDQLVRKVTLKKN